MNANEKDEAQNVVNENLRLHVPSEYLVQLEQNLKTRDIQFVKSISPDYFGGDHGGYNLDFENLASFEKAEEILEDLFTFKTSVKYSPEISEAVERLLKQYDLQVLKSSPRKLFGKTLKIKSSLRGRRCDLDGFFVELKRLKN